MRKPRPDEIPPIKLKPEMQAPAGYCYLAWQNSEYAHFSDDQRTTLCGAENKTAATSFVSGDPFGKPRCPACLELAGVQPVPDEPKPLPKELPPEEIEKEQEREAPSEEPLPPRMKPPEIKMPPPGFFQRKG